MAALRAALRNRSLWLLVAAYVASLAVVLQRGGSAEEPLAILVLFGIAFPLIALLTCLRAPWPGPTPPERPGEAALLAALLLYFTGVLAVKGQLLEFITPAGAGERLRDTLNTLFKLSAFAAIPVLTYRWALGVWPGAGSVTLSRARLWLSFAITGALMFAVTLVISNGSKDLLAGTFSAAQLALGLPLCFAWMAVEAGVVEEVFFRRFLQERIAGITGSQLSAICLGALAFALAHVPGMWLRGAGASEGLGEHPDLLLTAAYAVTVQGMAGIAMAVTWARTRSLALVIGLHALVDTASNAADFIRVWLS